MGQSLELVSKKVGMLEEKDQFNQQKQTSFYRQKEKRKGKNDQREEEMNSFTKQKRISNSIYRNKHHSISKEISRILELYTSLILSGKRHYRFWSLFPSGCLDFLKMNRISTETNQELNQHQSISQKMLLNLIVYSRRRQDLLK